MGLPKISGNFFTRIFGLTKDLQLRVCLRVWKSVYSQNLLFTIYQGFEIGIFSKSSESFYRHTPSTGASTPNGTASSWNTCTAVVTDLAEHEKVLDRDLGMPVKSYSYVNIPYIRI